MRNYWYLVFNTLLSNSSQPSTWHQDIYIDRPSQLQVPESAGFGTGNAILFSRRHLPCPWVNQKQAFHSRVQYLVPVFLECLMRSLLPDADRLAFVPPYFGHWPTFIPSAVNGTNSTSLHSLPLPLYFSSQILPSSIFTSSSFVYLFVSSLVVVTAKRLVVARTWLCIRHTNARDSLDWYRRLESDYHTPHGYGGGGCMWTGLLLGDRISASFEYWGRWYACWRVKLARPRHKALNAC